MSDQNIVVYPTPGEAIKAAIGAARMDGAGVVVCRGERVGCDGAPMPCGTCYTVRADDRAGYWEHVRRYFRGDA